VAIVERVAIGYKQFRVPPEKAAQVRRGGEHLLDAITAEASARAVLIRYQGYIADALATAVAGLDGTRYVKVHAPDPGFFKKRVAHTDNTATLAQRLRQIKSVLK